MSLLWDFVRFGRIDQFRFSHFAGELDWLRWEEGREDRFEHQAHGPAAPPDINRPRDLIRMQLAMLQLVGRLPHENVGDFRLRAISKKWNSRLKYSSHSEFRL